MDYKYPKLIDLFSLQNPFLQFSIHSGKCSWSLRSLEFQGAAIAGAETGISYRLSRFFQGRVSNPPFQLGEMVAVHSPHGLLRQVQMISGPDHHGLRCSVTFALPENLPFLFWKIQLVNQGNSPVWLGRLDMLNAGFFYVSTSGSGLSNYRRNRGPSGSIRFHPDPGELAFFSNGWQSWSYAGVYGENDRYYRTWLGLLHAQVESNAGTPRPSRKGLFASDMFGILGDRTHRVGLLAGFLSQKQAFGSLEALTYSATPALSMWANGDGAQLNPGASFQTDWACAGFLHLDTADPLGPYLEAVAREHALQGGMAGPVPENAEIPTGWSSWYRFYQKVTAGDVQANLQAASALQAEIPLRIVQIDDGFEAQVSDWYAFSPAFPEGVAPLAKAIHQAGMRPGLWLAPFIVHPGSRLIRQHPGWLLRNQWGLPVNAGALWTPWTTSLDLTKLEALAYCTDVIRMAVHEWGFPFLKLDFLYAAALHGRYQDPTKTRAQVLRLGLEAIRAAAGPETYLLGCGCPLGPAIGLVDAMRISSDVAERWAPAQFNLEWPFVKEMSFPAARNSVHNSLTRAPLHRRWWVNDPDCLLLRNTTRLTLPEVQTMATVTALTGGMLLLSDHLPEVPPERLWIAATLMPVLDKRPYLLDWFDCETPSRLQLDLEGPVGRWHLLALFNWDDRPADLRLCASDFYLDTQSSYLLRSFWQNRVDCLPASQPGSPAEVVFPSVPAHGVVLVAARPYRSHQPIYLGSDLHISQGLEVSRWSPDLQAIDLELERPGHAEGRADLYLPRPPLNAIQDGKPIEWTATGENVYTFPVRFEHTGRLMIHF
jgi:alpha-galactosidase